MDTIRLITILLLIAMMVPVLCTGDTSKIVTGPDNIGGTTTLEPASENAISVSEEEPDYLVYNETFVGYSILFPNEAQVVVAGDINTTRDTMFQTQSNVTIMKVTVVPTDLTLEEIINVTKNEIQNLPDFALVSSDETSLGGETAASLDYTWTDKTGSTSETSLIITVKNGRAYIIASQFPQADSALMAPVIDTMVSSFRFIPITVEKGWYYDYWSGWYWWPDTADWGVWNWDNYMQGTNDDWFSSSDYWGSGMDWIDVSNARWDWYMNDE